MWALWSFCWAEITQIASRSFSSSHAPSSAFHFRCLFLSILTGPGKAEITNPGWCCQHHLYHKALLRPLPLLPASSVALIFYYFITGVSKAVAPLGWEPARLPGAVTMHYPPLIQPASRAALGPVSVCWTTERGDSCPPRWSRFPASTAQSQAALSQAISESCSDDKVCRLEGIPAWEKEAATNFLL